VKEKLATIVSLEYTNLFYTANKNENYIPPQTIKANMSDGTTKEVSLTWTPATVDTTTEGTYEYTATVQGYNGSVKLHLVVKEKLTTIVSLGYTNLFYTVNKNENYIPPQTIKATMSDGTTKEVTLTWTIGTIDTSVSGKFEYIGSVEGSSCTVKLHLTVQ
jgi:uncharacterized protein with FMN-binding domain